MSVWSRIDAEPSEDVKELKCQALYGVSYETARREHRFDMFADMVEAGDILIRNVSADLYGQRNRGCRLIVEFEDLYMSAADREGLVVSVSGGIGTSVSYSMTSAGWQSASPGYFMLPPSFQNNVIRGTMTFDAMDATKRLLDCFDEYGVELSEFIKSAVKDVRPKDFRKWYPVKRRK